MKKLALALLVVAASGCEFGVRVNPTWNAHETRLEENNNLGQEPKLEALGLYRKDK